MAMEHVEGQRLEIEAEFRLKGVPTDPTVIRCRLRKPNGDTAELVYPSDEVARIDVGLYEISMIADLPGTWAFRISGVGVVDAVREVVTNVAASRVI